MHNILRGAACAAALLLAGCETSGLPRAQIVDYVPGPDLTAETAASLTGSKLVNPNIFVGDVRVLITHIDNARIQSAGGYPDQDKVVLVPPGTHYIRIVLARRDLLAATNYSACSEQFVELEAGKTYVARGQMSRRESTLWLDEVGSNKEQARATAGTSSTSYASTGYSSVQIIRSRPCAY